MLPRHLRLKSPQDFQAVRRRGSRWRDPFITLHCLPNGLPHNRFGIVVSRKVGSAVIRNKVKRRLRAAIARWLPRLIGGYDCVLTVQPLTAQAPYTDLEQGLGLGFRQLRLLAATDEEALI